MPDCVGSTYLGAIHSFVVWVPRQGLHPPRWFNHAKPTAGASGRMVAGATGPAQGGIRGGEQRAGGIPTAARTDGGGGEHQSVGAGAGARPPALPALRARSARQANKEDGSRLAHRWVFGRLEPPRGDVWGWRGAMLCRRGHAQQRRLGDGVGRARRGGATGRWPRLSRRGWRGCRRAFAVMRSGAATPRHGLHERWVPWGHPRRVRHEHPRRLLKTHAVGQFVRAS